MNKQLCKCIKCERILDDIQGGTPSIQPMDGLAFITGGHYGSTIFDPMDGSWLELAVCDRCLLDYYKEVAPHLVEQWNSLEFEGNFKTHEGLIGNKPIENRPAIESKSFDPDDFDLTEIFDNIDIRSD